MLIRFVFGDDIFISYSRKDGAKYAAALANELSKPDNNYSCFLDQWGASAADKLSKPVLRAIKRSSVLVLIGTSGAIGSPLVQEEVQLFGRRKWLGSIRPVLPINIDGALNAQCWSELTGLNRIPETEEARSDGVPSASVVRLIANSHSYTKRANRTRWVSITALLLLIASIVVGGFAAYQFRRATRQEQRANAESQRANLEAQTAQAKAEEARNNKITADTEAEHARASAKEAKRQADIARAKAREAEEQASAAKENAKTARSQELSAHARAISLTDPRMAVLEAIDAVHVKSTAEAEDALRKTLLRFPEQTILGIRGDSIISAELSPDDRFVVTTSFDGKARVFEVRTGQLVETFEDAQAPILRAVVSPNGKYLVLSGMNLRMMGINIGHGEKTAEHEITQVRRFPGGEIIHTLRNVSGTNISFSADSRLAVLSTATFEKSNMKTSLGNPPALLDLDLGKSIPLPQGVGLGGDAIFTPDNKVLIASVADFSDFRVQITVVEKNLDQLSSIPTTFVARPRLPKVVTSLSDGGKRIIVLLENILLVCDSRTGQIQFEIKGRFRSAKFSRDDRLIVTGGEDGLVQIFESEAGRPNVSFRGHASSINSVCFMPDDEHVLVSGVDNVLSIWRLNHTEESDSSTAINSQPESNTTQSVRLDHAELVTELTGHSASITSLSVSRNGDLIVAGGADGTTRIWDIRKFHSVQTQLQSTDKIRFTSKAKFSPQGDYLVTGDGYSAHLWNTRTGSYIAELHAKNPERESRQHQWLRHIVFDRTGTLILVQHNVTGNGGSTYTELYDTTGTFLARINGSINPTDKAAFSSDNEFIAVVNGNVGKIWSISQKRFIKNLDDQPADVTSIAFSSDGKQVVGVSKGGTVLVWSFASGQILKRVRVDATRLYETGFSPNGRYVFIRDDRHTQLLWDTLSGKPILLTSHDQTVLEWSFSADSRLIFTVDWAGKTVVHRTGDGSAVVSLPAAVLAFSANGKFVVDTELRVWDAISGQLFSKPTFIDIASFSAVDLILTKSNRLIAVSAEGTILRHSIDETGSLDDLLSIAEKRTKISP